MKYHFNYQPWCPFTSFLFFLTQNVDQFSSWEEEEKRETRFTLCKPAAADYQKRYMAAAAWHIWGSGPFLWPHASMLWTIWKYSYWWWHSSHPLRFLKIRLPASHQRWYFSSFYHLYLFLEKTTEKSEISSIMKVCFSSVYFCHFFHRHRFLWHSCSS